MDIRLQFNNDTMAYNVTHTTVDLRCELRFLTNPQLIQYHNHHYRNLNHYECEEIALNCISAGRPLTRIENNRLNFLQSEIIACRIILMRVIRERCNRGF